MVFCALTYVRSLIFPISDILFIKKYPEMGHGYYRLVSSRKWLLYR